MRILFLSDNFPPEVNAPASRTFEHCRRWVEQGHQVTVITCAPNFPAGKVFPGFRNSLWSSEVVAGIRVIRVWSYITANEGFSRRVLDYMSYMVSAITASPFAGRADVVVATSPQFFTACAGWVAGIFKRAPFVFELRDLWPESIKAVGAMQDSFLIRSLERVELFLYRHPAPGSPRPPRGDRNTWRSRQPPEPRRCGSCDHLACRSDRLPARRGEAPVALCR